MTLGEAELVVKFSPNCETLRLGEIDALLALKKANENWTMLRVTIITCSQLTKLKLMQTIYVHLPFPIPREAGTKENKKIRIRYKYKLCWTLEQYQAAIYQLHLQKDLTN